MHFNCVCIKMGFEALCPPSLGVPRYVAIVQVLLEVLPKLLPKSDSQINTLITVVRMETKNGYDLLFRVLTLAVPGFDPAIPVRLPIWSNDDDLTLHCHSPFTIASTQKRVYTMMIGHKNIAFLQAITEPAYTNVSNYYALEDDEYLPSHLCIMGLAMQLHKYATTKASLVVPRLRQTAADASPTTWHTGELSTPRALCGNDCRGCNYDSQGCSNGCGCEGSLEPRYACDNCPPQQPPAQVQGGRSHSRPPPGGTPWGQYARPDRNHGAYLPDISNKLDVLAIALFIEKYKKDMDTESKDKLEYEWVKCWCTAMSTKIPQRDLRAYIDLLNITMDELNHQLCWECWPDKDAPEADVEDDALA